jgi:ATP-binding cassette subfamily C protein CydC
MTPRRGPPSAGLPGSTGAREHGLGQRDVCGGGALTIGAQLALARGDHPAAAAIAVFAALALAEALAPLHRGIAEIGRMRDAAARLAPALEARQPERESTHVRNRRPGPPWGVTVAAPGSATALIQPSTWHVAPSEMVALTGRSGLGKSTCFTPLRVCRNRCRARSRWMGSAPCDLPETALRARLGVPAAGEPPRVGNHPQQPEARGAGGR